MPKTKNSTNNVNTQYAYDRIATLNVYLRKQTRESNMQVLEIIQGGNQILELDKPSFKVYYDANASIVKESKNNNYILEFELQHLQYLLNVDASYPKAISYSHKLLQKYKNSVDNHLLGKLYRWIGVAHTHIGELAKSMEAYMEALKKIEQSEVQNDDQLYELGLVYNNVAILYKNANENEKRLEYIHLALGVFKKIRSEKGLGMVYNSLGNYYTNEGNFVKALRYQRLSLKIKQKTNDHKGAAVNYGNIAGIYLDKGDFKKAEKYLKISEKLKLKYGNSYSHCHLYLMYGEFYLKQLNPARAISYLLKSHKIAIEHKLRFELSEVTMLLAETYEKIEEYQKSNIYLKEHLVIEKEISDIQKTKITVELTERYQIEKQLREAALLKLKNKEIKQHIQKLESYNKELQQFAQIASHDFKEPLRAIKMHLMLLERSSKDMTSKQKELVSFTKEAAERLYLMMEDLREYSDLENVYKDAKKVDVNMNELTSYIYEKTVIAMHPKKLHLSTAPLPILNINVSQVKKLFSHLIQNAFYYNTHEKPTLIISYRFFNNQHIFKFSDNGIGIAKDYYTKIFDVFQRLDSMRNLQSTGIGLAVCKKIVQKLDGKIWVKSIIGKGSNFFVSIPAEKSC